MEVPDFEIAGKNGIVSKSFNNLKIETFAPTLSEYDAMALAKGGVVHIPVMLTPFRRY